MRFDNKTFPDFFDITFSTAYNYIMDFGITTSDNYPYLAYKSDCVANHFSPTLFLNDAYESKNWCVNFLKKNLMNFFSDI